MVLQVGGKRMQPQVSIKVKIIEPLKDVFVDGKLAQLSAIAPSHFIFLLPSFLTPTTPVSYRIQVILFLFLQYSDIVAAFQVL